MARRMPGSSRFLRGAAKAGSERSQGNTLQVRTAPRVEFTDVQGMTPQALEKTVGAAAKQIEDFKNKG